MKWVTFNSLAPGKFEWNFKYIIFKWILGISGWGLSCEITQIWMSLYFTDDQSTLAHVMAWCRQATSHYVSQCWPRSLSPYGATRPWQVNSLAAERCSCDIELVILKLKDRYLEYYLWNCPQGNATRPRWWSVNIGLDNGLVPSSYKPLPESVLTNIYYGMLCY